jgi:hypothetical protein
MSQQPDEPMPAQPDTGDERPTPSEAPGEEPRDYPDMIDESSNDSFPASDPPSWTGSTATLDPEQD